MNLHQCKHIRIRNEDEYEINIEQLVKSIESQFKIDFTSLKDWKELLHCIDNKKQYYELKIKSANRRKRLIIDKLHKQDCRLSPFNLTNNLARTAHIWEAIKLSNKKLKEPPKEELSTYCEAIESNYLSNEISDMKLTAHPNSEIIPSENLVQSSLQASPLKDETMSSLIHLPVNICTNQHKLISPLESQFSSLHKNHKESDDIISKLESQEKYGMLKNQTKWIICNPSTIEINTTILDKQVVILSLTNSGTKATYIRFKTISDTFPFKKTYIYPQTPVKLYPGLSKLYKFVFKLLPNMDNINLFLVFRVERNKRSIGPNELLSIPLCLKSSNSMRRIMVTKTVNITPIYSWQINVKSNFPTGTIKVAVDNHSYYMYIKKRVVNFIQQSDDQDSVNLIGVNTDSLMQSIDDDNFQVENKSFNHLKNEELQDIEMGQRINEPISIATFLSLIVEEIIDLSLDTFIFQKTFLYLYPNCIYKIPVLFSKAEHEGYHQGYYNLEFYDLQTDYLVTTKVIKIFAEATPHPVQIHPTILDMTESPVNYGFREDRFIVTNTHKFCPVTLKIKMSKHMKQLFRIYPMEITVPYSSSAPFLVRICSKKFSDENKFEGLAHFTIKIIISGHDSIYRNVPPIFYELILPCAAEYNRVFDKGKELEM